MSDQSPGDDSPRFSPLRELVRVRFLEIGREPEAVFWTFIFPILLAVGLGIAFRNKPAETVHVGIVSAPPAAALISALTNRDGIEVEELPTLDSARAVLRSGKIALIVVPGDAGHVDYLYDDTRPDARTARLVADDAIQRGAGRDDPVTAEESFVRDPGSRYIDFVIPGLLGMNIMGSSVWSLGFTIVDARRRKLLKRFVATPMSRAHYLLSFLISRLVLLVVEVAVVLGFGVFAFGVPVRGSLLQLATVALVSAVAFGGLGLLISSRARTIEAASGIMNLAMMPMWVLSGVFFSAENFPRVVQPVIQLLPLTATIDAFRATMLRGDGWGAVAPELGILAVWGLICGPLALKLFRWR
jgi:ABC-2 type transport system permease protein